MASEFSMLKVPRRSLLILRIMKSFMLVLTVAIISFTRLTPEIWSVEPIALSIDECPLKSSPKFDGNVADATKPALRLPFLPFWAQAAFRESKNLTSDVFKYMMEKNLLQSSSRSLCIGEGSSSAVCALRSLGVSESFGVDKHPYFSLHKKKFVYDLEFEDKHFDFVFSRNLDCAPALVVMEIERVLRPGGTGALLVASYYSKNMNSLSATFPSFLKSSSVIHSCTIGSFTLILFQKKMSNFTSFGRFQLPPDCPSIAMNKPFMKNIEPLSDQASGPSNGEELTYLPKFMNISSRNRLVYVNIGAGEFARSSIQRISELYTSNSNMAFDKYVVHYIPSITYTYVPEPGINLVFYRPPGDESASSTEFVSEKEMDDFLDEEDFDFMGWFKETVSGGNFVILMMNAKTVELKILEELFRTGAICYVDELFLQCPSTADCSGTIRSLRHSGVYAHHQFP